MRVAAIAILIIAPVLLAQEPQLPDTAGPRVLMNQMGPVSNVQFISSEMVGGSPVTGAPYSAQAVTQTTQTLADGNRIVNNSSSMLYRDSQGRERRELPLPKMGASNTTGQPAQIIMISDPVGGVNYSLDTIHRTAHKMPAPSVKGMVTTRVGSGGGGGMAIAGALMPPPPDVAGPFFYSAVTGKASANSNSKVEQLGTTTIDSVQAVGTRTTATIPAGQIGNDRDINIVSERWYSPDLKMTVLSKRTDPRMGETDYSLTQINRSEPDPSLFQVPSDYTVTEATPGKPVLLQKPQE